MSNEDSLSDDVVILKMAAKYFDMNCHITRTLLINPTDQTGNYYQALLFLHKEIINNL